MSPVQQRLWIAQCVPRRASAVRPVDDGAFVRRRGIMARAQELDALDQRVALAILEALCVGRAFAERWQVELRRAVTKSVLERGDVTGVQLASNRECGHAEHDG